MPPEATGLWRLRSRTVGIGCSTPDKSHYRTMRTQGPGLEALKGESDMGSRREAANHETEVQARAYPIENKARPSRFGACQGRRDRKLEIVRIATQLSTFDR